MEFQSQPILVADSISMESEQNAGSNTSQREMQSAQSESPGDAAHPGATVPPPADSALLERDLPNVPPGDTTQDMNRPEMSQAGAATAAPVTDVLLIVPLPGPRDLIGKPVHLNNIPVRSQVGERGYWMGPTHTQQVFVRLDQNAGQTSLTPGQQASVWGTIRPVPSRQEIESEWQLDSSLAQNLISSQALYIRADSIQTSGT